MNSNKQNPLHSYSKKLLLFYTLYIYRCVVFAQIQPDTLQIDTVEISNISSSIIEEQVNNTNLKTVQLNRSDLQLAMHQAFWRHSNNCEKILRLQRGFVCKIL